MDSLTEITHRTGLTGDNDRGLVVGNLSLGLGVDSNEIKVLPNLLHQLVEVPFILRTDRHIMGEFIKQVKLLNGDGIDLVEDIDAGHINAISLNNINQVIHCVIISEDDIAVSNFVLVHDRSNGIISHLSHVDAVSLGDGDATTILLLELDGWPLLVKADAETFEFTLNNTLISHRFLAI